jgi:hypothetical protein
VRTRTRYFRYALRSIFSVINLIFIARACKKQEALRSRFVLHLCKVYNAFVKRNDHPDRPRLNVRFTVAAE